MCRIRRLMATVLVILALASVLAAPVLASPKEPLKPGKMQVPRGATEAYSLTVGEVSVTIPPGAMPKGGPVILKVWLRDGITYAEFLPARDFASDVLIDFGSAEVVYFHGDDGLVPIYTSDIDGDGEVGEFWTRHFSRYSGWF